MWKSPIFLAVVFLGAALVIAAVLSAGGDDTAEPEAVSETSAAETSGSPLPQYSDPDTGVGATAPGITAATFRGAEQTITADGTARLYGFFAHWCPHCQDEMPVVAEWLQSNDLPDGVEVVAISTGVRADADNYPPSAWFDREQWPTTLLVDSDENTVANGFGLTGYPYWVAVDGNGEVIYRVAGRIGIPSFKAIIDSLAATRSTP